MDKTKVVLLQRKGQPVSRVRVDGTEFPVENAGVVPVDGVMKVSMTLGGVDVSVETIPEPQAPAA